MFSNLAVVGIFYPHFSKLFGMYNLITDRDVLEDLLGSQSSLTLWKLACEKVRERCAPKVFTRKTFNGWERSFITLILLLLHKVRGSKNCKCELLLVFSHSLDMSLKVTLWLKNHMLCFTIKYFLISSLTKLLFSVFFRIRKNVKCNR